jgi:hypothetical protein
MKESTLAKITASVVVAKGIDRRCKARASILKISFKRARIGLKAKGK